MSLVREVEELKLEFAQVVEKSEKQDKINARLEEQINGERGLSATLTQVNKDLKDEIKGVKKAMYWVAGIIVAGSITMAFSAFSLIGGGP